MAAKKAAQVYKKYTATTKLKESKKLDKTKRNYFTFRSNISEK